MNNNKQSFKEFLKHHSEDNINNKTIPEIIENFLNQRNIKYISGFSNVAFIEFSINTSDIILNIVDECEVIFKIRNESLNNLVYWNSLELKDNQSWSEFYDEILEELQNIIDKTKSIKRTINKIEIYIDKIKDLCEEEGLNLNNFIDIKFNMKIKQ